jgi:CIC family chloride channel protein
MRTPLTALILVREFTGEGPSMIVPIMLALVGGVAVGYILGRRRRIDVD